MATTNMWDDHKDGGGFVKGDQASQSKQGQESSHNKKTIATVLSSHIQTLTTQNHGLIFHRHKFNNITTVGRVLNVNEGSTKCVYTIQDHVGVPYEVQLWRASDENQASSSQQIVENSYVRVVGNSRKQAGSDVVHIIAYKVVPITDPNEITMHLIENLLSSLVLEKKKNNLLALKPATLGFPGSTQANMMQTQGQAVNQGNSTYNTMDQPSTQSAGVVGMNEGQTIVLRAISSCLSPSGISLDELKASIRSLNPDSIKKALEFLSMEGHIYTTIDDFHYKATDG